MTDRQTGRLIDRTDRKKRMSGISNVIIRFDDSEPKELRKPINEVYFKIYGEGWGFNSAA